MTNADSFTGKIEFAEGFQPPNRISHALFDFDGTLSLLRQGWPEVMVPLFVEMLPRKPGDTEESLRREMFEDIMRLNGKQTIYQMIQFADRVKERGGVPKEPLWYKHEYLRRLQNKIEHRHQSIRSGETNPDEFLVFNARELLNDLAERAIPMYLASGTDEQYVREEARLLKIDHYFGPHIHGARDNYKSFSKKMAIDRILKENNIPGEQLLSFGDGYVEIQNTKEVGGLAVAVASDEARNGAGNMDEWKRARLLGVGADIAIPDFRDGGPLLTLLLDKP